MPNLRDCVAEALRDEADAALRSRELRAAESVPEGVIAELRAAVITIAGEDDCGRAGQYLDAALARLGYLR